MEQEKFVKPMNGYSMLFIGLALIGGAIATLINAEEDALYITLGVLGIIIGILILPGLIVVNPNESSVLVLFGKYHGTVVTNGFYWVNPFYIKKRISLRARNLNSEPIKVNDKLGNPIMIGIVLVWKVKNTFKAAFEVDDYAHFVNIQSESAIRRLAGHYPYDNFDDEMHDLTLRSGGEEVNSALEQELAERLAIAGIEVVEARISYLAYASEIAGAMLQRQQATAIVAARQKIVEGAVGMVEMALAQLSEKKIVELDPERKAAMVSNLMVVLTSDKSATPVVNTGSLY
jgi:regulator of protease activity HflC (stomatin/prohibitin superfamily)